MIRRCVALLFIGCAVVLLRPLPVAVAPLPVALVARPVIPASPKLSIFSYHFCTPSEVERYDAAGALLNTPCVWS